MGKNEIICETCVYYTYGKDHGNCIDLHYCEKKQKAIYQHKGNAFHTAGQWIIPCNRYLYIKKHKGDCCEKKT